jgi:hypothetical protein
VHPHAHPAEHRGDHHLLHRINHINSLLRSKTGRRLGV